MSSANIPTMPSGPTISPSAIARPARPRRPKSTSTRLSTFARATNGGAAWPRNMACSRLPYWGPRRRAKSNRPMETGSNTLEKAVGRRRDHDLVLDGAVVGEPQAAAVARGAPLAVETLHVLPNRGFRIVALAPGPVGTHVRRQV